MKKLLLALIALGAVSFVSDVEAKRCKKQKSCKTEKCHRPCEPKCTTEVKKEIFYTPCKTMIEVDGQCANERCITTTRCEEVTEKCIGGCEATCENATKASKRKSARMTMEE